MFILLFVSSFLLSGLSYGLDAIEYEARNGMYWIKSKSKYPVFTIKPAVENDRLDCVEVFQFIDDNPELKVCKSDTERCLKRYITRRAKVVAFGSIYMQTGIPSKSSTFDWDIQPIQKSALDPKLLNEYAKQLGIDPKKAVVASINGTTLPRKVSWSREMEFRPFDRKERGGTSWFLQNTLKLLSKVEASNSYMLPPTRSSKAVQFGSKILNCELLEVNDEYVRVPFNYSVDGLRPVSESVAADIFGLYSELKRVEFPEPTSKVDKAILYGYEIAVKMPVKAKSQYSLSDIVRRLFKVRSKEVELAVYQTAEELRQALQVVDTYDIEGGYIKLIPKL